MKAQKQKHENAAPVIAIDQYRKPNSPRRNSEHPYTRRTALIRETAALHLTDPVAPPVGMAMVLLRTDGRLASIAEAIEPEQADLFAEELETLAKRLRAQGRPPAPPRKQRGFAMLGTVLLLTFVAATYIIESAIIDALLTLIAQLSATTLARRSQ
ncbi:hypothetical protein SB778_14740 [Paraburkholderia sp. SIMBA_050]